MKIKVQRNKLNDAIGKCLKAVANKPIIPSTGNILLSVFNDTIKLSATDTTLSVVQEIPCEYAAQDVIAVAVSVSARVFSGIISSLTRDSVELDILENEVKISADGTNLSLPIIPGDEFPSLPEKKKKLFELTEDQIDELNALAVPFCSVDNARVVLNGLRIRRKDGQIEFMACDGFRYSYLFSESKGEDFDINIPARSFKELKGLGKVELWTNADSTQVIMLGEKGTAMSTVLETHGYFELPTYVRKEFNPEVHTRVIFGANTLVGPVKLAASVSNEINHQVDLDFKPESESVSIAAEATGKGSGTVESKCEIQGQPAIVAFDSNYLLQSLEALKNRAIVMELETGAKMAQFSVQGKDGFVHGLLPLSRQEKK